MQTSRANILILIREELKNLIYGIAKRTIPKKNCLRTSKSTLNLWQWPRNLKQLVNSSTKTPNEWHNKRWYSLKIRKNDVHLLQVVSSIHQPQEFNAPTKPSTVERTQRMWKIKPKLYIVQYISSITSKISNTMFNIKIPSIYYISCQFSPLHSFKH